jgi:hypothetical protein
MNGPLFPLGFEVEINKYLGLERPDRERRGLPGDIRTYKIESVRMLANDEEEYDEAKEEYKRVVNYPDGWEYQLVSSSGREWGWEREADLLEAGYVPPTPAITHQTLAELAS